MTDRLETSVPPEVFPGQTAELEIDRLTNLGAGVARIGGWVVFVPFALPGERVRARVWRRHANYSEADLLEILRPSPHRIEPACPLFGECGGCQYQTFKYEEQLRWKREHVRELLTRLAGVEFRVEPTIASPRIYGYRSKITPHFQALRKKGRAAAPEDMPIGFLRAGRRSLVDVPSCPIATEAINLRFERERKRIRAEALKFKKGATLLLRQAEEGVVTDPRAVITESIALGDGRTLKLRFLAGDFFQNNPSILPGFADYVTEQAASRGARFLVDAYCGSGLFALAAAPRFERVAGIEISETSVAFARENADLNGTGNASFQTGDASAIFGGLDFPSNETAVIIDPPRRGCDSDFLDQLTAFCPATLVYVSCDPATQMRDLRRLLGAGYRLVRVQPFDLFPQTRHLECVITLEAWLNRHNEAQKT